MAHTSQNLEETRKIAKDFSDTLKAKDSAVVVALQGDLGAGKTTFAQQVGEILGIKENMNSPTFVIEKVYDIDWRSFKKFIHVDAYRLDKDSELLHLGWEEIIKEPKNLIFIEWPENVANIIPEGAKRIFFKFINDTTREITYEK